MLASLLILVSLVSAEPELSRAEMAKCVGTTRFAADLAALAVARAQAGSKAWDDACRAAREADERRRSTLRVLFATGHAPTAGFGSATKYLRLSREAADPMHRELYRLVAHDQAARESLRTIEKTGYAPGATPLTLRLVDALGSSDGLQADAQSRDWLEGVVKTRGWFTISRDGEAADNAAWLIAQHADADPDAQRRLIAVMEPLAATGETNVRRFSNLYDRWARTAGAPQRYGWMGECAGTGVWTPRPIQDEVSLGPRREAAGLPPMAEYVAQQAKTCR